MKQKHLICLTIIFAFTTLAISTLGWTATTEIVSVNSAGIQGNSASSVPSISADGRFVAFVSNATNFVDINGDGVIDVDTNGDLQDVFVYDRQTKKTEIVSVNSAGVQATGGQSFAPSISADGRFVAFYSQATNLVDIDGDGVIDVDANGDFLDVFVYDRQTKKTEIVSVNSAGVQGNHQSREPSISADGRFVTFHSNAANLVDIDGDGVIDVDANGLANDVFVYDRQTKKTEIVSINSAGVQGNGSSFEPSISADGRFVAFVSNATNLVDINGDGVIDVDANGTRLDVFVHDRQTKKTEIVSLNNAGVQANSESHVSSISADGRFVTFFSYSTNLVDINGDGVIDVDANGTSPDVFVHDRQTKKTEIVSVNSTGVQGNSVSFFSKVSGDGRFVAFYSDSTNLVDINGDGVIDVDANGSNFDVFVHDRQTKKTEIVSVNSPGVQGNSDSFGPSISADGQFVAFFSQATNLVDINGDGTIDPDRNGFGWDVFVYFRGDDKGPVSNQPPTGSAGGPYSVSEGGSVTATATGDDPEDGPLTYSWDLDNNGTFETPGQSVTFSAAGFDGPDSRTIRVQVTDNGGLTAVAQTTVTVNNVAPTATFGNNGPVNEGSNINLSLNYASDVSSVDTAAGFQYAFDCGSGSGYGAYSGTSTATCATNDNGTRVVKGKIKDKDGGESEYTASVTVNNVAPTATFSQNGPVNEGSNIVLSLTSPSDPSSADTTAGFQYAFDCGSGSGYGAYSGTSTATCSTNDNGTRAVKGKIKDKDGGEREYSASVIVNNVAPLITSLTVNSATIDENGSVTVNGSFTDVGGADTHTVSMDWGDGSPATAATVTQGAGGGTFTATRQYLDDNPTATASDIKTIKATVRDDDGGTVEGTTTVTVNNVAPVIAPINVPIGPQPLGATVNVSAPFTDVGTQDTHTCTIDWEDGVGPVAATVGAGTCSGSRTYAAAGVYQVTVKVTDDDTGVASRTATDLIVVYDPSAGFVTGGGWFNSPMGADRVNQSAVGKANFGFVAKYKPGASVPDGQTEFQFQAGNLNFHSTSYEWLVVTGGCLAQYKGTGTVNGVPGYDFLLTLRDGDICGSPTTDGFRIKITGSGGLRYDNRFGDSDDIDPQSGSVQTINGGSIKIHRK